MAFKASVLDYDLAATPRRLQVGTGVGVDFHADSDLDDARCFPSHDVSPCGAVNMLRNLGWTRFDACPGLQNLLSDFSINEGGAASKSHPTHARHAAAVSEILQRVAGNDQRKAAPPSAIRPKPFLTTVLEANDE
jgi:hypothetical protein